MRTTCEACQAPIVWAISSAGKRMPMNAVAVRGVFTLTLPDDPESGGVPLAKSATVYTSHFATCPEAATFRKAR